MIPTIALLLSAAVAGTPAPPHLQSAILRALHEGDNLALRQTIEDGANVNEPVDRMGWKPIMVAASRGNVEAVAILLEAGASPNAADVLNETTLHIAVGGPAELLELLVTAGARVNATNAGKITPLMVAAGMGDTKAVRFLLKAGADPRLRDREGMDAAAWASRRGHLDLAAVLNSAAGP